jgi:putative transposase
MNPGYSYHVTQRGLGQRPVFREDRDRYIYLSLLREAGERHGLSFEGYCLMVNHVHLIAVPGAPEALHRGLQWAHAAYARYFRTSHGCGGPIWQARLLSCVLGGPYRWRALAYVEMNPVRAGLTSRAEAHAWSSAGPHLELGRPYLPLRTEEFGQEWDAVTWRTALQAMTADYPFWKRLREATEAGRPLAPEETLTRLEEELGGDPSVMRRGPRSRVAAAGQAAPGQAQSRLEFGD